MSRRILGKVIVSLLLTTGGLILRPQPVAAAGACGIASGASDKIYVDKDQAELGYSFDLVRGDATVSYMQPCVGPNAYPYASGSWILVANIESSNKIQQVGYGKGCSDSVCPTDFIWTPNGYGNGEAWPGSLTPVYGHRIRGIIERKTYVSDPGVVYAHYTITDVTTGVTQTADTATWNASYSKAWWGAEALDTSSEVGVHYADLDDNMAYMGYSTTANGSIFYRSGMTFDSCYCETTYDLNRTGFRRDSGDWVSSGRAGRLA